MLLPGHCFGDNMMTIQPVQCSISCRIHLIFLKWNWCLHWYYFSWKPTFSEDYFAASDLPFCLQSLFLLDYWELVVVLYRTKKFLLLIASKLAPIFQMACLGSHEVLSHSLHVSAETKDFVTAYLMLNCCFCRSWWTGLPLCPWMAWRPI